MTVGQIRWADDVADGLAAGNEREAEVAAERSTRCTRRTGPGRSACRGPTVRGSPASISWRDVRVPRRMTRSGEPGITRKRRKLSSDDHDDRQDRRTPAGGRGSRPPIADHALKGGRRQALPSRSGVRGRRAARGSFLFAPPTAPRITTRPTATTATSGDDPDDERSAIDADVASPGAGCRRAAAASPSCPPSGRPG